MNRVTHRGAALAAVALSASLLTACGSSDSNTNASAPGGKGPTKVAISLTDNGCDPATTTVPAGAIEFTVTNPGTANADEVELKDADGTILGERENLAPGISSDFTLTLQPGRYVLNCAAAGEARDNGTVVVTGDRVAAQGGASTAQLADAVTEYKEYVGRESDALVTQTTAFVAALTAGDVQRARDLFGATRSHYEAIEPIAESFGDLDPEIDARVNDVADRTKWTGFHRIELILWQQSTTKGTERYGDKLVADVKRLDAQIPGLRLQAAQIANGAVELLDEVSRSKITGEEDRYSHTDLADFQGNLIGSKQAFEALEPALLAAGGGDIVHEVDAGFEQVQDGLDRYKRKTALGFAPYSELTKQDRRQFAQQVAALTEPLSEVAGKLTQS